MNHELSPLEEQLRKNLIETIEKSVLQRNAEEQRILQQLFGSTKMLLAKELAREIPGKDPDPAAARQHISALRDHIELFSLTPAGKQQPLKVRLENVRGGGYYLQYEMQDLHSKKVWEPYLNGSTRPVLIVYTEPQFFRLGERVFVRHQDVDVSDPAALKLKGDWVPRDSESNDYGVKISRHFVSSGETDAVLVLTRWFERLGVETEHVLAHHYSRQDIAGRNIVLIGNKRTFPEIADIQKQQSFHYRIEEHQVIDQTPGAEFKYPDVFQSADPVKGVVSRFHRGKGSCVTILASNHGRFFEAAVRSLTDNGEAELLWTQLGVQDALDAPKKFELIGQAYVTPHEELHRNFSMEWIALNPSH